MGYYEYKGVQYPEVEMPMFAEIRYVEGLMEKTLETFSATERFMGEFLLAVRRVDVKVITWQQLQELAPGRDIGYVDDPAPVAPEEAQADPTDAVARTAPLT